MKPLGSSSGGLDCRQMISVRDNGWSSRVLVSWTMPYVVGPAVWRSVATSILKSHSVGGVSAADVNSPSLPNFDDLHISILHGDWYCSCSLLKQIVSWSSFGLAKLALGTILCLFLTNQRNISASCTLWKDI